MTSETIITRAKHVDEDAYEKNWSWRNVGAIAGLAGGFLAILLGFILSIIIWAFKSELSHTHLQMISNGLFYSAFPLMFFGAYCLDKIDEINKEKSRQNLKK